MKQIYLLLFLIASCLALVDVSSLSNDFRNARVIRALDLSTSIVKEDIGIRAKNTGKHAMNVYYFILPTIYLPFIASYTANSKQGSKDLLQIEPIGLDTNQ